MNKKKYTLLIADLGEVRDRRLRKLSKVSMKSKSVLVREAIDLLFKTAGGTK